MSASRTPVPPAFLASRVGPGEGADPIEAYLREGAAVRARIERLLPPDWSWADKRVLDFGCGAARVLRQFLPEAERAELWGCDIDAASIAWIEQNLSPPLQVFRNDFAPPLPLEDGFADLIYATSVFTHIDELWSDWLLELHRVLAPGGRLIASFLGEGMWEALIGEPYGEDTIGMTVRRHWTAQDAWVFHSEWWLREHWGRLFEVDIVARPPRDAAGTPQITHSYIALSKRAPPVSKDELERCDPAEPRELAALRTSVRLLRAELEALHRQHADEPLITTAQVRRAMLETSLGRRARSLRRRGRALRAQLR